MSMGVESKVNRNIAFEYSNTHTHTNNIIVYPFEMSSNDVNNSAAPFQSIGIRLHVQTF